MEKEMQGKTARILIVVRDGSSGGHLDYGRFRMMEEGYDVTVAAPAKKPLQTVVHYPHSIEFKRQVVQEFLGGESLHALARRHGIGRNLIKIWVAKFEAGGLDSDT